jgi:hypothetical protein
VGLSAFDVANRAIELWIAAMERNIVRVYLLTRETSLMSKVKKKSKKQPSTTTRTSRKNLLPGIMGQI